MHPWPPLTRGLSAKLTGGETTPQSRCSRDSPCRGAPLLSATRTFPPLAGESAPDKGSQGLVCNRKLNDRLPPQWRYRGVREVTTRNALCTNCPRVLPAIRLFAAILHSTLYIIMYMQNRPPKAGGRSSFFLTFSAGSAFPRNCLPAAPQYPPDTGGSPPRSSRG